jgi:hypothetical protein
VLLTGTPATYFLQTETAAEQDIEKLLLIDNLKKYSHKLFLWYIK